MSHDPFCGLRALWESERLPHRLPRHPEAALGSIVHEALRRHSYDGADAVLSYVREALSGEDGVIATAATVSGKVSLRDAIPATRLSAKLAAARRFATAISEQPPRRSENVIGLSTCQAGLRSRYGTWREVLFASDSLQLKGQMDLFRAEPGRYGIIDFKTGKAASDGGKPSESYTNQLHYYSMLAVESGYGPECELTIVGADGSFHVEMDAHRLAALGTRLSDLVTCTHVGVATDARGLARVSGACLGCPFRPWCGAYLSAAPELWRAPQPNVPLPIDTWGVVLRVLRDHGANGFSAVHLRDAASRLVCITGVPSRLSSEIMREGTQMGFFAVHGRSTGSGHPQNFALAVPSDLRSSSHTGYVSQL